MKIRTNSVIKGSISSILVLLVLINSTGCYSKVNLFREDTNILSEGDDIIVRTRDGNEHDITVARIVGTTIHGIEKVGWPQQSQIVIHAKDISVIQVKKLDTGNTILFSIVGIGVTVGILLLVLQPTKGIGPKGNIFNN